MRGESEVRSEVIGELVMNHLEKTDQIAYVRLPLFTGSLPM